jgi:hypothetical protein
VVQFPVGAKYSALKNVQSSSGVHHASKYRIWGTLLLAVKWAGHEPDHSPPSNVEVKNEWRYTTTPLLMACIELTLLVQNKRFDGLVRDILKGEREICEIRNEI